MDSFLSPVVIGTIAILFALAWQLLVRSQPSSEPLRKPTSASLPAPTTATSKPQKAKGVIPKSSSSKFSPACTLPDSPYLMHEVGGHSADIVSVSCSPDGKMICSVSRDGLMRCTAVSDIGSGNQLHSASVHLTGTDAYSTIALAWTANSKRVAVNIGNKVVFFRVDLFSEKKLITEVKSLETSLSHIYKIQLMDVEKWMLVAVAGENSDLEQLATLFDHNGFQIGKLSADYALEKALEGLSGKSKSMKMKERTQLVSRKILLEASPDNRFLTISGHVADKVSASAKLSWNDIGVYEVCRLKTGEPTGLELIFVLAGHESPVAAVAWNPSGQSVITVCESGDRDSLWRLWNTSVPKIDLPVVLHATSNRSPDGAGEAHVALNQPGTVAVFVIGRDIYYCLSGNGEVKTALQGALGSDAFHVSSSFLQQKEKNEMKWCFVTIVKGAKKIAIWKFKV